MPVPKVTRADQAAATKAAILTSARRHFEQYGYEGSTIRAIAQDAGIDPSMVMRYYVSKENLFVAASAVDLRLQEFADVAHAGLGRAIAEQFVSLWEDRETGQSLRILLASALVDAGAAEQIRGVFFDQVIPAVRRRNDDAEVRAGMIASQILGFALCRYVLGIAPVAELEPSRAVDWLGPAIQGHLDNRP